MMVRFDLKADPVDRGEPTLASVVVSDSGKRGAPALPENPIQAQRQFLYGLFCHIPLNLIVDRASIAVWLRRGDDAAALHPRFTHGPQI
jgi:hypothetical protein